MKNKTAARFWEVLTEYVPIAATVLISLYLLISAELNEDMSSESLIRSVMVIFLSLSFSLLIEKIKTTREIRQEIRDMREELDDNKMYRLHGSKYALDIAQAAANCRTLDLVAWDGENLFVRLEELIEQRIKDGCVVRILILDKASPGVDLIQEESGYARARGDIENAEARYRSFLEQLPERYRRQLQVRKTRWVQPFGMVLINRDRPDGILSIGLHPIDLKQPESKRRYIAVRAADGEDHFNYYVEQFEAVWAKSPEALTGSADSGSGDGQQSAGGSGFAAKN